MRTESENDREEGKRQDGIIETAESNYTFKTLSENMTPDSLSRAVHSGTICTDI